MTLLGAALLGALGDLVLGIYIGAMIALGEDMRYQIERERKRR